MSGTDRVEGATVKPPKRPWRWRTRIAVLLAGGGLAVAAAPIVFGRATFSMFIRDPWDAIPRATPEEIAKVHEPEALRADLDAIVALHERTCPNPYLRVPKDSILELAERLKASIDRPMTRREFLPLVMELQAGYRCDHYEQGVPSEDLAAAFARGERLLPFRAAPEDDALVASNRVTPSSGSGACRQPITLSGCVRSCPPRPRVTAT
jgi:hypothetical protein